MQKQDLLKWVLVPSHRKNLLTAFLFLLPSLLVFGVFVYYALGLMSISVLHRGIFCQRRKILLILIIMYAFSSSKTFLKALSNYCVFCRCFCITFAGYWSFSGYFTNQKDSCAIIFLVIFSPYVTTTAAISLLWVWIFQPDFGLFNFGLNLIGINGPSWLSNPKWAMPALIIMNVWHNTGYVMVIFLAGLQGIDRTLYEAAAIDGAGGWKKFLNITLPLLSPTTFFIMVTTLLNNFNTFDQVAVMTKGGPAGATTVMNYFIYQEAFVSFRAGYASAASTVLFLILLVITIMQTRVSRRWVHY